MLEFDEVFCLSKGSQVIVAVQVDSLPEEVHIIKVACAAAARRLLIVQQTVPRECKHDYEPKQSFSTVPYYYLPCKLILTRFCFSG
jgi:hypothetical protein